jgi:large subunit ribosomal protein L22
LERKVRSKEELTENREAILEAYKKESRQDRKPVILTKKERKHLGIGKDEGRASVRNVRISDGKVRLLLNLIKGKSIQEAFAIVKNTPKAASQPVFRLLKSAEANAVQNNDLVAEALYVAEATATQGPTMKRVLPKARGSANRIKKRSCHITVVVRERLEY